MNLTLTTAERRLQVVLRGFVILFALAVLIYGLGPFADAVPILGSYASFMRRLPFVAFSVVKVFTLLLVCLYAAGDPRDRLGLVWVAVGGHAISVAAMLVLLATGDTTATVSVGAAAVPIARVLWGAIALDGVILAVLLWVGLAAARAQRDLLPARRPAWTAPHQPGGADRALRLTLIVLAVVFVAGAVVYEAGALLPGTRAAFTELPFVTNSVVKVGTLALVAFYAANDIGPRIGVVGILYVAHVVSILTQLLFWLGAAAEPAMPLFGRDVPVRAVLLGGAGLDGAIALLLLVMWRRAYRARFDAQFLSIRGYRTLVQLADVVVHGPDEVVEPRAVAENVDRYFRQIRSRRGRLSHRLALFVVHFHPLLYLKPPFPELGAAVRMDHLKRHFHGDVAFKVLPDGIRRFVAGFIKVAKQLAYVGYYSDPAVEPSIGYVRFSRRGGEVPTPRPVALRVATPTDVDRLYDETDICVIGTGAAGAILAHDFAHEGRDVLMLERGRFVQPTAFTENEVEMIGLLYGDGVFQQTRDLRFTILQGSCVGGTTVVNNAVCFPPPPEVIRVWNERWRWNAGVDPDELTRAVSDVESLISVAPQTRNLNPSGALYMAGVANLGLRPPHLEADVVRANINDCLGCGYCNIGCAYGRKLSMLDRVLPAAQAARGGRLRIVAEAEVERIVAGRPGPRGERADVVCARFPDGRLLTVRANKIVVAAGTIASSWILLRSGIGRGLPVGRGLSFNMGAPLTADFGPDPVNTIPVNGHPRLNAYAGLQISHYGRPSINRGWVFETWWNPPVAQAINMPGWFEQHYLNMRRYPHLMAVGALVGTESNGHVARALLGGPDVIYSPTAADRRKLADGLIELGRILFAADARRIMVNAWNYYEFTSPDQLAELIPITLDPEELALGTGHPQGGNAVSQNPEWGVVGPDFRVHGWENLYVCDASVFPTSLTVNPQLTVMALAHYASPRILV